MDNLESVKVYLNTLPLNHLKKEEQEELENVLLGYIVDCQKQEKYIEQLEEELKTIAEKAYKQGWLEAATWAHREDLIADIDSVAYEEFRHARLSKLGETK